jgi:hypothetical protein
MQQRRVGGGDPLVVVAGGGAADGDLVPVLVERARGEVQGGDQAAATGARRPWRAAHGVAAAPDARRPAAVPYREHHGRLALAPTPGLRDWRREMSAADAARFEAVAGDALAELGY